MSFQCQKCGSRNHATFDCAKPDATWRERISVEAERIAAPAPSAQAAIVTELPDIAAEPMDAPHASHSGLSGPLPKRKSFPFLRAATRLDMDRRIHAAQFGRAVAGDLPAQRQQLERSAPVALPKAAKKPQAHKQ